MCTEPPIRSRRGNEADSRRANPPGGRDSGKPIFKRSEANSVSVFRGPQTEDACLPLIMTGTRRLPDGMNPL